MSRRHTERTKPEPPPTARHPGEGTSGRKRGPVPCTQVERTAGPVALRSARGRRNNKAIQRRTERTNLGRESHCGNGTGAINTPKLLDTSSSRLTHQTPHKQPPAVNKQPQHPTKHLDSQRPQHRYPPETATQHTHPPQPRHTPGSVHRVIHSCQRCCQRCCHGHCQCH